MTLEQLLTIIKKELNGLGFHEVTVKVLDTDLSHQEGGVIDYHIIGAGYDVNSGVLYIESTSRLKK